MESYRTRLGYYNLSSYMIIAIPAVAVIARLLRPSFPSPSPQHGLWRRALRLKKNGPKLVLALEDEVDPELHT